MSKYCFIIFSLLWAAVQPQVVAGQAVEQPLEITESGEDYLSSLRLSRVDSNVAYYDPTAPAPPFDTKERPRPKSSDNPEERTWDGDVSFVLAAVVVLILVMMIFQRFGGSSRLVLRKTVAQARRAPKPVGGDEGQEAQDIPGLEAILAEPNRHDAVIKMAQLLITRAVQANGLLLQRSWTARDVLRRMPHNSAYLSELRDFLMRCERVHFGEQPVSEDDFAGYVAQARPLLRQLST